MVVITCKECKESIYLTPHAFCNLTDFGAKCEKCETINTITPENGELKKTGLKPFRRPGITMKYIMF
jgi:hypothetical protein